MGAGDLPSLRLWQQGGIGICPLASYGDLSVIVAKNSITKPADFRQKKVGILLGAAAESLVKFYLASGGVDVKDVDVVNLRPMEMVTDWFAATSHLSFSSRSAGWRSRPIPTLHRHHGGSVFP